MGDQYYGAFNTSSAPAPLTGTIITNTPHTMTVTPPLVGMTHHDPTTGELFIFDGGSWVKMGPVTSVLQDVACDKYRGRKARKCANCGVKYIDHDEGQVAYLRERLLAMQRKVREL